MIWNYYWRKTFLTLRIFHFETQSGPLMENTVPAPPAGSQTREPANLVHRSANWTTCTKAIAKSFATSFTPIWCMIMLQRDGDIKRIFAIYTRSYEVKFIFERKTFLNLGILYFKTRTSGGQCNCRASSRETNTRTREFSAELCQLWAM